jgi:hypothetical protein
VPEYVTNINIFISCPGDVEYEKQMVKDVCREIYESTGKRYKINLIPRDWKEFAVFSYVERPQHSINNMVGDYDVFIGILWKRFGTPTGKINPNTGREYESGTEEEMDEACIRWKEKQLPLINFYFKLKSDSIPELSEIEQITKVQKFKQQLQQRNSGINEFQDVDKFKTDIRLFLTKVVLDYHDGILQSTKTSAPNPPESKIFLDNYLQRVVAKRTEEESLSYFLRQGFTSDLSKELLNDKRIMLVGDPGIGKSTELKRIEYVFSGDDSDLHPLFIPLNTYVDETMDRCIPRNWSMIPEKSWLILLDGLDEVQPQNIITAKRRIQSFANEHPLCHMIVSCRTNFIGPGGLDGFNEYVLSPLDTATIKKVLSGSLGSELINFENSYSDIFPQICNNPFYLFEIIRLFKTGRDLKHE